MERLQYETPTLFFLKVKQRRVICSSEVESSAKMNVNYEEETWE